MQHDGREERTDAPARRGRFAGSLRGRLILAAVAATAPLLLGAGVWLLLLSHSTAQYRQLADEAVRESDESVGLLKHLNDADEAGIRYLLTGRAEALREFRLTAAKVDSELADTSRYDEPSEIIATVSIRRPWTQAKAKLTAQGPRHEVEEAFDSDMRLSASGLERLLSESQQEVTEELAA